MRPARTQLTKAKNTCKGYLVRFTLIILPVLFMLCSNNTAHAQNKGKYGSKGCMVCISKVHDHEAPYDHTFKNEIPFIIASGASLTAGLIAYLQNDVDPYKENELDDLDITSINSFDRRAVYNYSKDAAQLSDYIRTGATILPIIFISEHHTRKDLKSLVVMSLEVFSITYGLTNLAKHTVNRTRPFVYNPEVPVETRTESGSRLSFFSGHTSHTAAATFFIAKVFSDYHPKLHPWTKAGIWTFSAALPMVTGYLRVEAGKHFPTDVITGYAVGASVGWLVPHLHKRKKHPMNKLNMGVLPYRDGMKFSLRMKL